MSTFKRRMLLAGEYSISGFKYLLGALMVFEGITTAFSPTTPMSGALGFIYSTRISLVLFGIVFFISGATLLYGKIRKSKARTGRGLMYIYLCFLFTGMLNLVALGWPNGIDEIIGSFVVGALYLRWRFKTAYINPKHYKD